MRRKAWTQLNRLRTVHGQFNAILYRMGLADNKNCVCGDIQSASHILYHCTVMAPPCSTTNTTNEDLIEYLRNSSPKFLERLLECENLVRSATSRTKTALGIIQIWLNYFAACLFKALGIMKHLSREAKDRDALVVSVFSPISIFEYGNDHPSLPIFRFLPEHQATWHARVSQRIPLLNALSIHVGFHHSLQPSHPSVLL